MHPGELLWSGAATQPNSNSSDSLPSLVPEDAKYAPLVLPSLNPKPPALLEAEPTPTCSNSTIILSAILVGVQYGLGSSILGMSSRLLDTQAWAVVTQLNAFGRVLGLATIIGVEGFWRGNWPKPGSPGTSLFDSLGWMSAVTSAAQVAIYIAVHFLTTTGDVDILLALTMLYNVVPVAYGILCAGERLTLPKAVGFAASAAATVCLAIAGLGGGGGGGGVDGATIALQVVLLCVCICGWGTTDTIFARVGRRMHVITAAAWYAMGCIVLTAVVGQGTMLFRQAEGAVPHSAIPSTPTGGANPLFGYLLILGTNATATLGWYGYVKLGQVADASLFVPIVAALMTALPAIVTSVVLGEGWGALKVIGVIAAVLSAVAMGVPPPKSTWCSRGSKLPTVISLDPASTKPADPSIAETSLV